MNIGNKLLICLASVIVLVGCGGESGGGDDAGSGYSGNESAATVSESNKSAIATTASVGAEKAIDIEVGTDVSPFSLVRDTSRALSQELRSLSPRVTGSGTYSEYCDSGSISYSYDIDNSGYGTYEYSYNNCTISSGSYTFTYNGDMVWEYYSNGSSWYEYDFTYSYNGQTYTITSTASCDASYNCTFEENFSSEGVEYRVTDVSVSYSSGSGTYDVAATVYHENFGYIEIVGEDLAICSDGNFSSGTITVTDSTNSTVLTVVYNSCTSMTITYNSVAETVSQ